MSPSFSRRLTAATLLGLALFILRDVLFLGQAFFERDLLWVTFPGVEAFVRAIAEGALPLRDPTTGFGQPILGTPESQVLYPPTWLHLVFLPDRAFPLIVLTHFLVGGSGAAALCWRISGSAWASFLAGAFWMISGPFQSTLNVFHHFSGTVWMPWVLVAFDRLLEKPVRSRMLMLGGVFGVQILAGSADLCALTMLLAFLRLLCEGPGAATIRTLWTTFGALGVGLSLGAGMWMPAWEIVRSSVRSDLPREERVARSIHPLVATEFVLPTQIGILPWTAESSRRLTGDQLPFQKSLFLGPLILPLLAAALMNTSIARKYRAFLALGALIAGLGALGQYTPVYDFLVAIVPPLRLFRYPSKAALPLSLLISVLSAIGASSLDRVRERRVAGGFCALMFLGNAWLFLKASSVFAPLVDASRPALVANFIAHVESGLLLSALSLGALAASLAFGQQAVVRLSVALGIAVTLLINRDVNQTVSVDVVRFRPGHAAFLLDKEPARLFAFDYVNYPARSAAIFNRDSLIVPERVQGLSPAAAFIVVVRNALMPPTGGAWKIEYGWDRDLRGLFDRTLRDLTLHFDVQQGPVFLRMLQIANISRVAALHTSGFELLTLERTIQMPLPEPLYIFRVPDPLPRAYAVSGARALTTALAQTAILDPTFNPQAEITTGEGSSTPISDAFRAKVVISDRRSDRVSVDATLNEPGHVVLLEGFLPGWRATLDGASVAVHRANALFLAVTVPSGNHRIVFTYRPMSAVVGMSLTALTAALLLISLVRSRV